MLYEFGSFRLDTDKHRLLRNGEMVSLTPKAIETLRVLIERPNQIVEREELMKAIWPDVAVEDGNLSVTISMLRKVLSEEPSADKLIETIPRQGYRFVGDVRVIERNAPVLLVERYTKSKLTIDDHLALDRRITFRPALIQPKTVAKFAVIGALCLSIGAFGYFIRSRSSQAAGQRIRTVAVLPFRVINNQSANTHQGLGLADILITRLSNLREITVRPTASILPYQSGPTNLSAVGSALNVDAVLDGSIYEVQGQVRVTARLVIIEGLVPIWSGHFEKPSSDQIQLQNEIALQVASALEQTLSRTEHDALTKRYTSNPDAFDLYVQGRYEWNKRNFAGFSAAQYLFRQAIEKDPKFALAYVGVADSQIFESNVPEVQTHISKALELDPNLGEAYASYGLVLAIHSWNWQAAEDALKRAIELNPNYATAHQWYATLLGIQGRYPEAKAEMERAIEINPNSYNLFADLAQVHIFLRDYDKAREYCNRALTLFPDFHFAHGHLASISLQTGDYENYIQETALAVINMNVVDEPPSQDFKRKVIDKGLGLYRRVGIRGYLEDQLRMQSTDVQTMKNANSYYGAARLHSFLGNKELALQALETAYSARAFLMPWLKTEAMFDNLRSEPRFKAIVEKMNLPAD